ncbi:MAG: GTP-binding protein [Planctomycetota bacterium]
MEDFKIMIAGHKQHGKSAIIKRLLYERGFSFDTPKNNNASPRLTVRLEGYGIAESQIKQLEPSVLNHDKFRFSTAMRDYILIDTSGYGGFLSNMVDNTHTADAAILVVDCLKGPGIETWNQVYIMGMFGIQQAIVIINKMDLTDYDRLRFWDVSEEVDEYLRAIGINIASVIPASASYGDNITSEGTNMPWNTAPMLMKSLDLLYPSKRCSQFPLRFVVECVCICAGRREVQGRILTGRIIKGQQITFTPQLYTTEILEVIVDGQSVHSAGPGQWVGLLLRDSQHLERGLVGCNLCSAPLTTDYIVTHVFWTDSSGLKTGDEVKIRFETCCCIARIEHISNIVEPPHIDAATGDAEQLMPLQAADVRMKLARPVCVDPFGQIPDLGKFAIFRNNSLAGGGILR